MKITHGATYKVEIDGNCVPPGVEFSFTQHDFGATFLHKHGMPVVTRDLEIYNTGTSEVSVDSKFKSTNWLEIAFEPVLLKPNKHATCTFKFKPNHEGEYSDVIPFLINGTSTYKVNIRGYGSQMRIELKKRLKNDELKFGSIRIGEIVRRKFTIINRVSLLIVSFFLRLFGRSSKRSGSNCAELN